MKKSGFCIYSGLQHTLGICYIEIELGVFAFVDLQPSDIQYVTLRWTAGLGFKSFGLCQHQGFVPAPRHLPPPHKSWSAPQSRKRNLMRSETMVSVERQEGEILIDNLG